MKKSLLIILLLGLFCFLCIDKQNNNVVTYKSYNDDNRERAFINEDIYNQATLKDKIRIENIQSSSDDFLYKYFLHVNEISGVYKAKIGENIEYLLFDSKGDTEFSLKANQSIEIFDIPLDVAYTVRQLNSRDGYSILVSGKSSTEYNGVVSITGNNISFKNYTKQVNSNPYTVDKLLPWFIVSMFATCLVITLFRLKIVRYE